MWNAPTSPGHGWEIIWKAVLTHRWEGLHTAPRRTPPRHSHQPWHWTLPSHFTGILSKHCVVPKEVSTHYSWGSGASVCVHTLCHTSFDYKMFGFAYGNWCMRSKGSWDRKAYKSNQKKLRNSADEQQYKHGCTKVLQVLRLLSHTCSSTARKSASKFQVAKNLFCQSDFPPQNAW